MNWIKPWAPVGDSTVTEPLMHGVYLVTASHALGSTSWHLTRTLCHAHSFPASPAPDTHCRSVQGRCGDRTESWPFASYWKRVGVSLCASPFRHSSCCYFYHSNHQIGVSWAGPVPHTEARPGDRAGCFQASRDVSISRTPGLNRKPSQPWTVFPGPEAQSTSSLSPCA